MEKPVHETGEEIDISHGAKESVLYGRHCIECGAHYNLRVDKAKFERYKTSMELVQVIFPELDANEREMIMTGIHGDCFDYMFREED